MQLTLLADAEVVVDATIDGDRVLVPSEAYTEATGWTRKPEGMCRGAACVPVRDAAVDGPEGTIDLTAAANVLHQRIVLDREHGVAAVAGDDMSIGLARNLHEITLPDLDGNPVHLSKLAGKKTVLIAWASW